MKCLKNILILVFMFFIGNIIINAETIYSGGSSFSNCYSGGVLIAEYNTMGGNKLDSTVQLGDPNKKLSIPTRSGYDFIGWYYDESYTKKVTGDTIGSLDKNYASQIVFSEGCKSTPIIKLYARWEKKKSSTETYSCPKTGAQLIVNYVTKGGSNLSDSMLLDDTTKVLATPTKNGYDFIGWYYDENYTMKVSGNTLGSIDKKYASVIVDKNGCKGTPTVKLYAGWTLKPFTDEEIDSGNDVTTPTLSDDNTINNNQPIESDENLENYSRNTLICLGIVGALACIMYIMYSVIGKKKTF